uniref:Katanin p80 subunit C-terminal domain-containing protein n=1 Tax=Panagrolaimus sp. PS1159 TaxID=55785 RepID=A0AC35GWW5_9BILA
MATKSDKYSFVEQSFTTSKNQCYNLNFNQNKKCATSIPVQSNSKPNNDKNYEKEKLQLWNKSFKATSFTIFNEDNKDFKKRWKNENILNATNKSTLSLRITAYKNLTTSDFFDDRNTERLKKGKFGTIKASKQCFTDSLKSQNPFEFPRQQNGDQRNKPEVMQFKASQRLLGSSRQSSAAGSINIYPTRTRCRSCSITLTSKASAASSSSLNSRRQSPAASSLNSRRQSPAASSLHSRRQSPIVNQSTQVMGTSDGKSLEELIKSSSSFVSAMQNRKNGIRRVKAKIRSRNRTEGEVVDEAIALSDKTVFVRLLQELVSKPINLKLAAKILPEIRFLLSHKNSNFVDTALEILDAIVTRSKESIQKGLESNVHLIGVASEERKMICIKCQKALRELYVNYHVLYEKLNGGRQFYFQSIVDKFIDIVL